MRKFHAFVTVVLLAFLVCSCSHKMHFATSPVVPAATGSIKTEKDKNGNYFITVDVVNLAEAKNLTPPKSTYVVWMESEGTRIKNIGQINPSSGLLSKALKGELKATATAKPTRFFITAEDNGNVQYPGTQVVLKTE